MADGLPMRYGFTLYHSMVYPGFWYAAFSSSLISMPSSWPLGIGIRYMYLGTDQIEPTESFTIELTHALVKKDKTAWRALQDYM